MELKTGIKENLVKLARLIQIRENKVIDYKTDKVLARYKKQQDELYALLKELENKTE